MLLGYPDRIPQDKIPQDKIPQDKIPTDKIPQDRIPQDKIPQPEMWTKSHNMKSWQWDGFKLLWWTGFIDKLYIVLYWRGRARWLFQPDVRHWDVPTCTAHGQVGVNLQRVPPRFTPELWNITQSDSQLGTSDEQPVWGMEQPILSSGGLQSFVNLDGGRGHPNGEPESRDTNRQDLIGQPLRKRIRRQYVSLQTRFLALCQYRVAGRRTIDEFLTGIRHNILWMPSNRHAE